MKQADFFFQLMQDNISSSFFNQVVGTEQWNRLESKDTSNQLQQSIGITQCNHAAQTSD